LQIEACKDAPTPRHCGIGEVKVVSQVEAKNVSSIRGARSVSRGKIGSVTQRSKNYIARLSGDATPSSRCFGRGQAASPRPFPGYYG
jgi:hypothetical protein